MAGPGRVRSAGNRRRCGLRGGGQKDGRKLDCSQMRPPSLAHSLLARSLAPSLPPCCLPARLLPAACCLLTLSLALPAFAAHAGRYVTANRRDSGEDAHVPCAAALRFGSGRSSSALISRVPVPCKRQVRGWVLFTRTESQKDSGTV